MPAPITDLVHESWAPALAPLQPVFTEIGEFRFRVLNADSRRIHLLRLTPINN